MNCEIVLKRDMFTERQAEQIADAIFAFSNADGVHVIDDDHASIISADVDPNELDFLNGYVEFLSPGATWDLITE